MIALDSENIPGASPAVCDCSTDGYIHNTSWERE